MMSVTLSPRLCVSPCRAGGGSRSPESGHPGDVSELLVSQLRAPAGLGQWAGQPPDSGATSRLPTYQLRGSATP